MSDTQIVGVLVNALLIAAHITAYACNSAVVQSRAKRRMAARQRTSLYHNDTLGNTGDISCD